jgi:hypothetical protein
MVIASTTPLSPDNDPDCKYILYGYGCGEQNSAYGDGAGMGGTGFDYGDGYSIDEDLPIKIKYDLIWF